ncbi:MULTISPECIES: hypothetical protein [Apibacter]|uniref:hypothetical protein n=2 Tax=Weeksellaceae TaxID=2762318 RepID=UPI00136C8349|nr:MULTISPECIES: hypothetical protein [Apibacter]MXO33383.1 hypothetical protein [Apibacter sp. B2912]
MKTKLLLISTITLFAIMNCQEKKEVSLTNKKIEEKKMETSKIKDVLIKQIKEGASSEYWGETYGKEDLDALVQIEDTILKNNGYKTPEREDFNQKIKKIFGRIIDNQSENSYLKIDRYDKCDKDLEYYPTYMGFDYVYVAKKHNFITRFEPLPAILDYQKIYPEVLKYEENSYTIDTADGEIEVSMWKDFDDLPQERYFNKQRLISRNKYLFNDDKSQFPWLVTHDEFFMESLVTTFGYTEDKKLLKWVMEKNYKKARDFIKKNLFVKDCEGNLEVREGILKYIEETTNNEEKNYVTQLLYLSKRDNWKDFNEEQYFKIIAYMANTFDPLSDNYSTVGLQSKGKWSILGILYYEKKIYEENGVKINNVPFTEKDWTRMLNEFKKNNFYNLPNLKLALNIALKVAKSNE